MKILNILKKHILIIYLLVSSLHKINCMEVEREQASLGNDFCCNIINKQLYKDTAKEINTQLKEKKSELIKIIQKDNKSKAEKKLKNAIGIGLCSGIGIFAFLQYTNSFHCNSELTKKITSIFAGIATGITLSQLSRFMPDTHIIKKEAEEDKNKREKIEKCIPLFDHDSIINELEKKKNELDYWLGFSWMIKSFMKSSETIRKDLMEESVKKHIKYLNIDTTELNEIFNKDNEDIKSKIYIDLLDKNFDFYKNAYPAEQKKEIKKKSTWWKFWENPEIEKKAELVGIFLLSRFSEKPTEESENQNIEKNKEIKETNNKKSNIEICNYLSHFKKGEYSITLFPENKQAEPKQAEPKEAEPKEAEPKEAEPKEAEPKEAEPKEAEPKEAAQNAEVARRNEIILKNLRCLLFNASKELYYKIRDGLDDEIFNKILDQRIKTILDKEEEKKEEEKKFNQKTTYEEFRNLKNRYQEIIEINHLKNVIKNHINKKFPKKYRNEYIKTLKELKSLQLIEEFEKGLAGELEKIIKKEYEIENKSEEVEE